LRTADSNALVREPGIRTQLHTASSVAAQDLNAPRRIRLSSSTCRDARATTADVNRRAMAESRRRNTAAFATSTPLGAALEAVDGWGSSAVSSSRSGKDASDTFSECAAPRATRVRHMARTARAKSAGCNRPVRDVSQ